MPKTAYRKIPPEKIKAWVAKYFPDYKTRRGEAELVICNPFDGDTKYKFNISVEKGLAHDWRGDFWAPKSQRSGKHVPSFVNFVMVYRKCTYRAAIQEITGQSSWTLKPTVEPEAELEIPDSLELPAGSLPIIGSPAKISATMCRHWLHSRGIGTEIIELYNIHHSGTNVVWPYYEYDAIVYWQQRSITDKRFLFPEKEVADKDYLYGFDQAQAASHIMITEGIVDALSVSRQALASGGAILTPRQVLRLQLLDPREGVILIPDNDSAGIKSLVYNSKLLREAKFPHVYYSIPPKVEYEPGEFTKDWNDLLLHVCNRDHKQVEAMVEQGLCEANDFSLSQLVVAQT